jgi:hypothetical protein
MSNPVAKIVDRHLKIWNTRNAADRITGIPSTYAEDVVVGEPAAWLSGFAGIEYAIKAVQAQMPGMDLAVTGPDPDNGGHVYLHLGARGERRQPRCQGPACDHREARTDPQSLRLFRHLTFRTRARAAPGDIYLSYCLGRIGTRC